MRLQRRSLIPGLVLVAGGAIGCGDDPVPPETTCEADPTPTAGPATSDADEAGFVRIQDIRDRTLGDDGTVLNLNQGRIQAGFGDFSELMTVPPQQLQLGANCVGITSLSNTTGARIPLELTSVTVNGTERGAVALTESGPGVFNDVGMFVVPSEGTLEVVGVETSSASFVGFTAMAAGVEPLTLDAPASDGSGALEEAELPLAWQGSGGDWVEILLTPERDPNMPNAGGQVACRVADVGCFTLPLSATLFLLSSQRPSYTLSIKRIRYVPLAPEDRAFVEIEVSSEWKTTLDNALFD